MEKIFNWIINLFSQITIITFESRVKLWFSLLLEFTKISGSNYLQVEKKILECLSKEHDLTKDLEYWIIKKSMTNYCFMIADAFVKKIGVQISDDKVRIYVQMLGFITANSSMSANRGKYEYMRNEKGNF